MRGFYTILFGHFISLAVAQPKPIAEVDFSSPIIYAYVDRPGDLYLHFEKGVIKKLDLNGKGVAEQNSTESLTLFDPRDGSRSFTYYNKSQEFGYSHFGSELKKSRLNEEFAVEPLLVCSSGDKNIWILDKGDFSLKRVNLVQPKIDAEARLPDSSRAVTYLYMREYQNFLFLLDAQSRIFIFNSMGRLLKEIKGHTITWFNFLGEELYFQEGNKLIFHDLFDGSVREIETDPLAKFTLLTDERRYLVYEKRVVILTVN